MDGLLDLVCKAYRLDEAGRAKVAEALKGADADLEGALQRGRAADEAEAAVAWERGMIELVRNIAAVAPAVLALFGGPFFRFAPLVPGLAEVFIGLLPRLRVVRGMDASTAADLLGQAMGMGDAQGPHADAVAALRTLKSAIDQMFGAVREPEAEESELVGSAGQVAVAVGLLKPSVVTVDGRPHRIAGITYSLHPAIPGSGTPWSGHTPGGRVVCLTADQVPEGARREISVLLRTTLDRLRASMGQSADVAAATPAPEAPSTPA